MGWWGFEPLAGDTPLDLLAHVPEVLGIDPDLSDLYPSGEMDEATRTVVAARLDGADVSDADALVQALVDRYAPRDAVSWKQQHLVPVAWQVLAVVWMASGAPMPDEVRDRVRAAVDADQWRLDERGSGPRTAALDQFVASVRDYAGQPTPTKARTLADAFEAAADAGHGGIVNVGPEANQ